MQKTLLSSIRPLTKKMKNLLQESYDREMQQQVPGGIYYTQSAKGLITRGLFYAKEFTAGHKSYLGFYLTQLGIDYVTAMKATS